MTDTPDETRYFIRKGGYYYRPNAQGYTASKAEAGRYTLDEAIKHSHPNGPDGPRDGITYVLATLPAERRSSPLAADVAAMVQKLRILAIDINAIVPDETDRLEPVGLLHKAAAMLTALAGQKAPPAEPTASALEVAGLIERLHGNARQLRNFYAGESGTGLHVLAADTADEAAAVLSASLARVERMAEALWKIERNEDAAYSRDLARTALEASDAGIGEGVGRG